MAKPRHQRQASGGVEIDSDLERLRDAIDVVDREILEKLNARARLVSAVGDLKRSQQAPVYVAGRERDLVAALRDENSGPFPTAGIQHVFREIISATRTLEQVVRVAFLGPAGTFSHQATLEQFGALVELVPAASIREVFELTERGQADFGIVPVENTIEGVVSESFDALVDSEVTLCGELLLEISQNLLAGSGDLKAIRKVASHPQPLAQCRGWLAQHLPGVETIETASTAAAAKRAAQDASIAAIGSETAALAYGLEVVRSAIEDHRGNTTRFVVIGHERPRSTGADLTSVVFTVRKDQRGTLYRLLEPFARYEVNVNSIQSRPIKGKPWEYLFFLDLEGHIEQDHVRKSLEEAAELAHSSKVLGSFPRASSLRRTTRRGR
ncbi:MAG: prephenate dehydratase [Myxococcota bacterium]